MANFLNNITQAIGNTYLMRLDRLKAAYGFDGEIYAKLEHMSPGFSKKDRIALGMIEAAEKRGELVPGMPVVEMTSGNTGIGAAICCAAKGYRFICVLSKGNSVERVKMIQAFGGELVLVDQAPGAVKGRVSGEDLRLVELEAERIVKETGALYLNQFNNFDNSAAQESIAAEIWEQSGGAIQVFADFIGTGGTFSGCSKKFKELDPAVRCYAVEPHGCAFYKGEELTGNGHRIQGGGYAKHQTLVDTGNIDGCVVITDEEAIETARDIARLEGIFGGFSSGANVRAAVKLLNGEEKGKRIAVVINDCGLKYMSTDLF